MDRVLNSARQLDNFTWNLRQEIRMIEWEQRKKLVRIVGPNIQRLKHVFGPRAYGSTGDLTQDSIDEELTKVNMLEGELVVVERSSKV